MTTSGRHPAERHPLEVLERGARPIRERLPERAMKADHAGVVVFTVDPGTGATRCREATAPCPRPIRPRRCQRRDRRRRDGPWRRPACPRTTSRPVHFADERGARREIDQHAAEAVVLHLVHLGQIRELAGVEAISEPDRGGVADGRSSTFENAARAAVVRRRPGRAVGPHRPRAADVERVPLLLAERPFPGGAGVVQEVVPVPGRGVAAGIELVVEPQPLGSQQLLRLDPANRRLVRVGQGAGLGNRTEGAPERDCEARLR